MTEVTQEMIDNWKQEKSHVFKVTLNKVDYYYTTLKKKEYIELITKQSTLPDFNYELETLKVCVLSPIITNDFATDLENKSGLGFVLLEHIMIKSGWEQVESEEL